MPGKESTVSQGRCPRRGIRAVRLLPFLLVLLLTAGMPVSADEEGGLSLTAFRGRYNNAMQSGSYGQALSCALSLRDSAMAAGNIPARMLADSYAGQAWLAMDGYDSAYVYLSENLSLWNGRDSLNVDDMEYLAMYVTYNGLGVYSIVREMDYGQAVAWLLAGMELAEERSSYYYYAVLGSNLVYAFNLRQDTSGLRYAREIYRYGLDAGNDYLIFTGSSTSAMMYYLRGDLDSARRYADEAVSYEDMFFDMAGVYAMYGDILHAQGDDAMAEVYYRKALGTLDGQSVTTVISAYLSYGRFLLDRGRFADAVSVLDRGIDISDSRHNRIFAHRLYLAESEAYERMGQYRRSLEMYRLFHVNSQEVLDLQREKEINELTRKYENEKHQREIQQNNLTIMRKDKALLTAVFFIVLALVALGMIWALYRHKNRMYALIARQYKDAIGKEKAQERKIAALEEKLRSLSEEPQAVPASADKNEELLDRLETLMKKDKVYKEKGLNRDRVAHLLGTNRTYLSQMINEKTGMSFIHYVNSFRIDEALEILSDPGNDVPLKALCLDLGFSSMTTFYTFFQKKVGMTPAKYREEVRLISNSTNCRTR